MAAEGPAGDLSAQGEARLIVWHNTGLLNTPLTGPCDGSVTGGVGAARPSQGTDIKVTSSW